MKTQRQKQVPQDVQDMAKNAFLANKRMNNEKKSYEGLRKTLLDILDHLRIGGFRIGAKSLDDKDILLDVNVATPDEDVVSVEKLVPALFPLVSKAVQQMTKDDQKKFFGIFSCTKKSVEDYCGKLVLQEAIISVKGTRNVSIKEAKQVG